MKRKSDVKELRFVTSLYVKLFLSSATTDFKVQSSESKQENSL